MARDSNRNPIRVNSRIFMKVKFELLSGTHIGHTRESVGVGGIDNSIVRRKDNNEPYLPGSSIKGKLKSELSRLEQQNLNKVIETIFGTTRRESLLTVRSAYLSDDSVNQKIKNSPLTESDMGEMKNETKVEVDTGVASRGSLRMTERIPAGAIFEGELVLTIDNPKNKRIYLNTMVTALQMLEGSSIGGSGSRGYGQVKVILTGIDYAKEPTKEHVAGQDVEYLEKVYQVDITDFV